MQTNLEMTMMKEFVVKVKNSSCRYTPIYLWSRYIVDILQYILQIVVYIVDTPIYLLKTDLKKYENRNGKQKKIQMKCLETKNTIPKEE